MLIISQHVYAQRWEIGANMGGTGYMGDINSNNAFLYRNLGGGLSGKYNFDPTWGARVNINYIRTSGADSLANNDYQKIRNLSFQNTIWELSAVGEFNFYRFIANSGKKHFTPYLFAGVAFINHNPSMISENGRKYSTKNLRLDQGNDPNDNQYGRWAISIPYGFGVKYNFNGPWSIGAEVGYRTALTNRIDNIAGNYTTLTYDQLPESTKHLVDEATWNYLADPSNNLGNNAGKPRGTGNKYDGYMTAGITITYSILSTRCYWW